MKNLEFKNYTKEIDRLKGDLSKQYRHLADEATKAADRLENGGSSASGLRSVLFWNGSHVNIEEMKQLEVEIKLLERLQDG